MKGLGLAMRGVDAKKLEPKELLDTRGWWRAERSMQGSEISRGAAARPVPSEVGTGWNARMRVGGRSVEMGAAKEEARGDPADARSCDVGRHHA